MGSYIRLSDRDRGWDGARARIAVFVVILVLATAIWVPAQVAPASANQDGKITFAKEVDGNWDIYVIDLDGSNETRLTTDPARDMNPSWSADGTKIAFQTYRAGASAIFVMGVDGGGQTALIDPGVSAGGEFAWSPDGTKFAYVIDDGSGHSEVMLVDAGNGQTVRVTQSAGNHHSPAWSPDGRHLAFSGERADASTGFEFTAIYVVDPNGGNERRVTSPTGGADFEPAWSPDGSTIAFRRREATGGHIYTVGQDGSGETRITTGEGELRVDPAWSPDGMSIVFVSVQGRTVNLWTVQPDGSGLTQITDNPTEVDLRQPDWFAPLSPSPAGGSPDSKPSDAVRLAILGAAIGVIGVALAVGIRWIRRHRQHEAG